MGSIDIELTIQICTDPVAWDAHNNTGTDPDAVAKDIRAYLGEILSGLSMISETATTFYLSAPKIIP